MALLSRGFRRGRRERTDGRLPPGQYDVGDDFPVLSAGPTPRTPLSRWDLSIDDETGQLARGTWDEFRALPREPITVDIHCVTTWSKFDTRWSGVAVDTLLQDVETSGVHGGPLRRRIHDERATGGPHRRPGMGRRYLRGRAAGAGARRTRPAAGAAPVPLEERQVAASTDVARPRRARLLGDLRIPQL